MSEQHETESDAPLEREAAGDADGERAPEAPVPPTPVASTASVEPPATDEEEDGPPLLPSGNPLRWRGLLAIAGGALLALVIMTLRPQLRFGVPLGAMGVLVATFGVLDLLGTFDDRDERVVRSTPLAHLASALAMLAVSGLATLALVTLAVAGRLGILAAAILIPGAFLATVISLYGVGQRLGACGPDEDGTPRPLVRRHGFWLVVVTTLIDLPMLGSHSLSDPWETHYGEVSREILARNDWISLWWAQDGWFWSKPVLDFWLQSLAMATFGVRYEPGAMLSAAAEGRTPWPEWAVRLPIFLLTLVAGYLLYKASARAFGRRAGLFGGIVLATMPQWFLVSHQTMTDMPFVATMASAMALFLLGVHEGPDREARVFEVTLGSLRLRFSAYHLVVGTIVASALPQILYLLSRNLELSFVPFDVGIHADAFSSGSAGNCGLPGNEACRPHAPVARGLTPALQALIWIQALGILLYINWGERRVQRLLFLGAWYFAALSTMAKGPAGVLLPVLCILAYVLVTRRYKDLLRVEVVSGLLILLAVAMPWFVAMYSRHGQPFTDRLLFHDMFKRAFTHVHDTNEGDDVSFRFYVWQLGYATFPWTGLVPAGLLWWLRRREDTDDGEGTAAAADRSSDASVFLAMWFLFAFALFSLMLTKFHHYILPAVPPAAMLTGVVLDALVRRVRRPAAVAAENDPHRAPPPPEPAADATGSSPIQIGLHVLGIGGGVALSVAGLAMAIPGLAAAMLPKGKDARSLGEVLVYTLRGGTVGIVLTLLGVALAVATAIASRRRSDDAEADAAMQGADVDRDPEAAQTAHERVMLGAIAIAASLAVLVVGRDLSSPREGQPSQARLLHLFTYNYKRPWPASLEFHHVLWAFTIAAVVLLALLVVARWRRQVVTALLTLGAAFAVWGIDVYFVRTSPHWGQRETLIAYQRATREIPGPVIAYQMNWKGENFYSGNRIPAFVSSGKKFTDYILEQKKEGVKTFYFLTEHGRTGTLSNELGGPRIFEKMTPPELNNKFLLVRATFE